MSAGPAGTFAALWESLLPLGRDAGTSGYRRFCWSAAEMECRDWFGRAAADRGLRCETDGNGNLWAWWEISRDAGGASDTGSDDSADEVAGVSGALDSRAGAARDARESPAAVAVGSHLDSVPDGGAFDGPLGVVSAFAAIDQLRDEGFEPSRPVVVAAFAEEEGGRFGVACLGSRLLTGAIAPEAARALRDAGGITLGQAMQAAGRDPGGLGPDDELLGRLGCYLELHIEQGRQLGGLGAVLGLAEGIWPHGRWRVDFTGRADHAGTAVLADRADPMLPFAHAVLAARSVAAEVGALATIGKVVAEPGAANAVSSAVHAWLDVRAADPAVLDRAVDQVLAAAGAAARAHRVELSWQRESFTPAVGFDPALRDRLARVLAGHGMTAPVLPTGAGHDAGVLAARLPTAMLFVRNPTGVSHAPGEHAEPADCATGVSALAAVLRDLAGR